MAKYSSRKVGEIHQIKKNKTDWGAVIGGILVLLFILAVIGNA